MPASCRCLSAAGLEQESWVALIRRWRKRCWLISFLGVIDVSVGCTFCYSEDAAQLKQLIMPPVVSTIDTPEILSQSDYGIRQRYMMSPEELIAAFTKAEAGKLHLYSFMSQIGTVANREAFDGAGRMFSTIYYQAKTSVGWPHPKDEKDLVVQEIHLYRYDERGREVWQGEYDRKKILRRSMESIYDKDGMLRFMQWRSADGIIRYKMLCDERWHAVGHVYFDDSGKRIIDFQGSIPKGMDASAIPADLRPKLQPDSKDEKSSFSKIFNRTP